jgi:hypothetical protein
VTYQCYSTIPFQFPNYPTSFIAIASQMPLIFYHVTTPRYFLVHLPFAFP